MITMLEECLLFRMLLLILNREYCRQALFSEWGGKGCIFPIICVMKGNNCPYHCTPSVQASFMTEYFPVPDVDELEGEKRMRDAAGAQVSTRRVCSLNELLEVVIAL